MPENSEVVLEEQTKPGEEEVVPPTAKEGEIVVEPEPPKMVPLAALEDERRKRQELEGKLVETQAKTMPPQAPTKSIEDYYEDDPIGTVSYINNEIARLQNEDAYGNALRIEQLRDLKLDLKEKRVARTSQKQNDYVARVLAEIPDFTKEKVNLENFAINTLGYTTQDLGRITDPNIVGEDAALKTMKLIKKQYDLLNGRIPVKRESKAPDPLPTILGGGSSPSEPDTSKMTDQEWYEYEKQQKLKNLRR